MIDNAILKVSMLPIERLDADIIDIYDDAALSPQVKQDRIAALVAARRADCYTTGASIHYCTGKANGAAASPLEALAPVRVAIARRILKDGSPDGIAGSAGGLAKRIASTRLDDAISKDGVTPKYPDEVEIIRAFGGRAVSRDMLADKQKQGALPPSLKSALTSVFDDVIELPDGSVGVTDDPAVILEKNIRREAREELGVRAYVLMKPTLDRGTFRRGLTGITDDRFVLTPAWWRDQFVNQGLLAYPCTATTTYMNVAPDIFGRLIAMTQTVEEGDGEITGLTAIDLPDLLTRVSGAGHGHPGHDTDFHYRHTHEGMVAWKIAAELLGNDPAKMIALAKQVAPRFRAGNPLDFEKIAAQTRLTLKDFDEQFGLPAGTFAKMQEAAKGPKPQRAPDAPQPR
jgi:8-oxo-dGTP pyrophosphatase MutT (NUDIX family)